MLDPTKKWGDNSTDDYNSKTQDCMIYKATPDTPYIDFGLYLGCFNYSNKVYRSFIAFYIKSTLEALGAVSILSAKLYLYPTEINGSHNVSAYRVVQHWLGAECTWNSFKTGSAWHTAGCEAADDGAVDDDPNYDRLATPEDTQALSGTGSYSLVFDITTLAQQWFSGACKEYGLHLRSDNEAVNTRCVISGMGQADGQRPYLEIDYNLPSYKLTGSVTKIGVPVQRTVRSYVRSTGALYDSVVSNADGSFEVGAPDNSTEMYVISLPADAETDYNALVFDRVKGVL